LALTTQQATIHLPSNITICSYWLHFAQQLGISIKFIIVPHFVIFHAIMDFYNIQMQIEYVNYVMLDALLVMDQQILHAYSAIIYKIEYFRGVNVFVIQMDFMMMELQTFACNAIILVLDVLGQLQDNAHPVILYSLEL